MKVARLGLSLLVTLAFSTTFLGQEIHTDYDHKVDFSQYHTYSWMKVKADDDLWAGRIQEAVDAALQKLGFQKVDADGDIAVAAIGVTRNQLEYQTFYDTFGPGWGWWGFEPMSATTREVHYKVGTLIVDLYDAKTKHLIWRGSATETLSSDPSKNQEKLKKAVEKMLSPGKSPLKKKEKG
jgi:hypothetical protein